MAPRITPSRPLKRCSKCRTPTDRLGTDPVTGTVGIPLCPRCTRGDLHRLCVLVAMLSAVMVWML